MSPDSPESRIGRLEQSMARLEQQVQSHEADIRQYAPIVVTVAELRLAITHLEAELVDMRKDILEITTTLKARDEMASQERRAQRNALYGLTGVIVAAIISALAVIVASGAI